MLRENASGKNHSKGFSLAEVLVGMTVGLLSMMVIMQTLFMFESQKRTTTAGSDTQGNGLIALVNMEQVIRGAGNGFVAGPVVYQGQNLASTFDCVPATTYSNVNPPLSLMPVQITDGGAGGSDSITVQTANNFLGSILTTTIAAQSAVITAPLSVTQASGIFAANDYVVVAGAPSAQPGVCTLMQISAVQPTSVMPLNPPPASPAYGIGATIFDIKQMTTATYSVDANNNLQVSTSQLAQSAVAAAPTEIAADVVSLKAQYGIANAGTQNVNAWVDATGATWAAPTPANIKRIKAIRLALVIRSGKKEASNVTSTCTGTLSGIVNNGPCAWPDTAAGNAPQIDLSNGNTNPDWQKYRYKVYQTIIPLRNMIWAGV